MRAVRLALPLVVALPLAVASGSSAPTAEAAVAERIEVSPPGMDSRFRNFPLFAGDSGYVFYQDASDRVYRWNIDGSEGPLPLSIAANGIDTVTADGSRYRAGTRVYEITGSSYETLTLPSGFFNCPGDERRIGTGYSPSHEFAITVCFGGSVRVDTFGGGTRTFTIGDIPADAANTTGDVIAADDGTFRVEFARDASDIFGPGTAFPGKYMIEYDADGNTLNIREPTRISSAVADFYSRRSDYMPVDADPLGQGGYEAADGRIVAFRLAGELRPPAAAGEARFSFSFLHSFSTVGFGSACLRSTQVGEPRWCYEGDLIRGGGRWFPETDADAFQIGTITGDRKWYSRRTATDRLFVQEIRPGTPPPANRVCIDVAGTPGDFAVVNLTPVEAVAGGYVQLAAGDLARPPVFSNANFALGTIDPNVAIAPIGPDGDVCMINNISATHLIADHLGTIDQRAFTPARPDGTPDRKTDTRGGPKPAAGGRVCIDVAGEPGDYAVVNLTPVEADGGGYVQLVSSSLGDPPVFSNANYAADTIDPNVAIAPIGPDGAVCMIPEVSATHLVADHLGTIDGAAFTPAEPDGTPDRKTDTRGTPKTVAGGRVCIAVAGDPSDFAVVNLTPVEADGGGYVQLVSSDVGDPPVFSNANFAVGTIDPNVAIAPIGGDGEVCLVNSISSTHLIADHLGTLDGEVFAPANPDGSPSRKMDTRLHAIPVSASP